MARALLAASLASLVGGAQLPSEGCSERALRNTESLVTKNIRIHDFEPVDRTYVVQHAGQRTSPAPLLISIHGQTGTAMDFANNHHFTSVGAKQNILAVFPQGMNDSWPEEDRGTGWNVGSAGDNSTCVPEGVGDNGGCYKSCRKLKKCGRCNWSTCYNDVLFVKEMLKEVARDHCIDMNRIYLQGESNGAEMLHHLVRELPSVFAAVVPWFGTPLLGFLFGVRSQLLRQSSSIRSTALLSLHPRQDTTIPPAGGVSDGGWIFESEAQQHKMWAALHGCEEEPTPLKTKWDGGNLNFSCVEHAGCATGRRVIWCSYDGKHGDWPEGTAGDEITVWFITQFSRGHSQDSNILV